MAASLVQCRFSQSKIYVCKKHRFIHISQRFASKYITDYRKIDDEEPIEDIRDVSRLTEKLKKKLKKNYLNSVPEADYVPPYNQKGIRRYQRRMYAMYGDKYEINPATLWPTKDEIAKENHRDTFFDIPLEESFERIRLSNEEKAENLRKSEELIEKNMLKMKDWLKAYEERKRNAQLKEERSAEKKRLTEEKLYDHFGYQISVNTTKAKDYLRDLAEQEKKERKLQYKQDKQERERAQLKELLHKEAEAEKEKETK
uniref:Large ribosomal subunit protein mL64 n=2 Tax=Magallana gigas TaxID=29159 RepID=A0A8W8NSX4_MAGGI|nr:growth arrest and DNA damage-inducible proteins-interacting protein 1 [Crassostrea gigas]